jgi:hypothetical protein
MRKLMFALAIMVGTASIANAGQYCTTQCFGNMCTTNCIPTWP